MNKLIENIFGYKGFRFIMPLVDLAIIFGSNMLAYYIFKDSLDNFTSNYNAFWAVLPYMIISYVIVSHIFELDKPKDFSLLGIGYTVFLAIFSLFLITMALSFLFREFAIPRSILITSSIIQVVMITVWHFAANHMYFMSNKRKSVLVIGYEKSQALAYKLLEARGMWSNVKHVCAPGYPKICDLIKECDVTFITEDVEDDLKQKIILYCVENSHTIYYQPKNSDILQFNANFLQIDDSPVLDVRDIGLSASSETLKRIIDVVLGGIGLIIFFIPSVIVYFILKISGGQAFYVQERVTRDNKIFKIYKFRTMVINAEAISGPVLANDVDKRITKIGRILRATRMDEVPPDIQYTDRRHEHCRPASRKTFLCRSVQKRHTRI